MTEKAFLVGAQLFAHLAREIGRPGERRDRQRGQELRTNKNQPLCIMTQVYSRIYPTEVIKTVKL